jgi:hypothetical protein
MSNLDKESFLNPIPSFRGEFSPQNLAFNANLQEFTNRVSIICALETGGKISPDQAYQEIKTLWGKLEQSKSYLLGDDS